MKGFHVYTTPRAGQRREQRPTTDRHTPLAGMRRRYGRTLTNGLVIVLLLLMGGRVFGLFGLDRNASLDGLSGMAPSFVALFSWVTAFTVNTSHRIWQAFSFLAYVTAAWLLARFTYRGAMRLPRLAVFALAACFEPFYSDAARGGTGSILLLLFVLSFYLHSRRRFRLAALPMGLAIAFFPPAIAVLLVHARRRQWSYAVPSFLAASVLALAVLPWVGIRVYGDYAASIGTTLSAGPTWMPFLEGSPTSPAAALLVYAAVLFAVIVGLILLPRPSRSLGRRLDYTVACLCTLIFSPALNGSQLPILLIAYATLIGIAVEKYAESAASLRLTVTELLATGGMAGSLILTFRWPEADAASFALVAPFLSVLLLALATTLLMFKLSRLESRIAVPMNEYRLRKSRRFP